MRLHLMYRQLADLQTELHEVQRHMGVEEYNESKGVMRTFDTGTMRRTFAPLDTTDAYVFDWWCRTDDDRTLQEFAADGGRVQ